MRGEQITEVTVRTGQLGSREYTVPVLKVFTRERQRYPRFVQLENGKMAPLRIAFSPRAYFVREDEISDS